jgi:putative ABC transport system permease protein
VMPNLYSAGLGEPWPAEVLSVFEQTSQSSASISIRVAGDPTALAQPLRKLVASLDADLPVYAIKPMDRALREAMWPTQVFGGLFIVFGIVALALASIGLYAVLAFSVSRREREMGIRMALGAAAGDVLRLVFRDGAVQLAVGTCVGVLLGVAGARLGRAVFFQVEPGDPAMIAAVVAVLAMTGFAACVGPALRATKSDPVRSLRAE